MEKIIILLISVMLLPALSASHTIASGGKSKMQIVYKHCQTPAAERYDHVFKCRNTPKLAAEKLASFLKKMTGADFAVIPESRWQGKIPAFFIGGTDFAVKNGIDVSQFKSEEFLYRSIGKNIVIAGGENWGNEQAVFKFLEDILKCRFLAWDALIIPAKKELVIADVNKRGEPSFRQRAIYIPPTSQKSDRLTREMYRFLRFNRSNFQRYPGIPSAQYPGVHSFYHFVSPEKYFKSHPEYFSMNERGVRFCGTTKSRSGGQLCLSNKEVIKLTTAKLKEFIAADRKNTPRKLWPTVYEISQSDSTDYICKCPECSAITREEGSEAGLLIRFMNQISRSIAKEYPEIHLRTYAYVSTEKAPLKVRPEKNIILQWCDLYFNSDCFRPLTHKVNAKQRAILEGWKSRNISIESIWDYWNMGGSYVRIPRIETIIPAIAPDLRYYKECGAKDMFIEAEHSLYNVDTNFIELQYFLGLQLLDDIQKDEKLLIDEFMRLYYGPAAKTMFQILNTINEKVASEPKLMGYTSNLLQPFLNRAFVEELEKLFAKALAETKPGTAYRARVEREMLPLLRCKAYFDSLRGSMSKEAALKEYRKYWLRHLQYTYTAAELPRVTSIMEKNLSDMAFNFKTPEKFASIPENLIRKFCYRDITGGTRVKDPDAVLGMAVRIGNAGKKDLTNQVYASQTPKDRMTKNIFGLSNMSEKLETRFNAALSIPGDEKYHWYCLRNQKFGARTIFWGWSWWTLCNMSKVYLDGASNRYDVWFSLKRTGPVFVKGSRKENGIYLDCIVLTPPGAVK